MTISEKGLALIEHYEGFQPWAYKCPAGVWSIGIGTTIYPDGSHVKELDRISYNKANDYLLHDIRQTEYQVNSMLKVKLMQCQFDALVSFAYNAGCRALQQSTLLKIINSYRTDISIEDAFIRWNKCAGKPGVDDDNDGEIDEPGEKQVSKGLSNRRRAEAWLFLNNEVKYF
jgi:lysozyme